MLMNDVPTYQQNPWSQSNVGHPLDSTSLATKNCYPMYFPEGKSNKYFGFIPNNLLQDIIPSNMKNTRIKEALEFNHRVENIPLYSAKATSILLQSESNSFYLHYLFGASLKYFLLLYVGARGFNGWSNSSRFLRKKESCIELSCLSGIVFLPIFLFKIEKFKCTVTRYFIIRCNSSTPSEILLPIRPRHYISPKMITSGLKRIAEKI